MQYKFIFDEKLLNRGVSRGAKIINVFTMIKYWIEIGILYLISINICKKYFNNNVEYYKRFVKYLGFITLGLIVLVVLIEAISLKKSKKDIMSQNGIYNFINKEYVLEIKQEGLYVKDNTQQVLYYWDMLQGYYESGNYIYISDKLGNIIVIVPVENLGVERLKFLEDLDMYTSKSTVVNKKYAIIRRCLK